MASEEEGLNALKYALISLSLSLFLFIFSYFLIVHKANDNIDLWFQ